MADKEALAARLVGEVVSELREEETLIAAYNKALATYEDLATKCVAFFMPQAKAALAAGNIDEAHAVLGRCPDHVTKVFIMDLIRQYKLAREG
jgi:hypothetical protein